MPEPWGMPVPWCCTRTARWKAPTTRAPTAAPPGYKIHATDGQRRLRQGPPFRPTPCYVGGMIRQLFCVAIAALAGLVATVVSASAHPHVWVTMRSEVIYGPDGTITGIRHAWTFD